MELNLDVSLGKYDKFKEGMLFHNALFEEIKMFYPNEYMIGNHALYLIEKKTGIRLIEDEAATIAIHIVNAEYNEAISTTFAYTQMIQEMLEIIAKEIPACVESSNHRDRLSINLKHMSYRMMKEMPNPGKGDAVLFGFVREHCKAEYELIGKVDAFIKEKYGCTMAEEEKIYLTLNVKRIKDLSEE